LLAHGWWFSPASYTPKTGCHDIAESGIKHQKSNHQIIFYKCSYCTKVDFTNWLKGNNSIFQEIISPHLW
jgi:endogenous inhibitor of DNA gyrase (YacG/DUF329 family)